LTQARPGRTIGRSFSLQGGVARETGPPLRGGPSLGGVMGSYEYNRLLRILERLEDEAERRRKGRGADRQSEGPRLSSIRRRKRGRPEGAARDGFTT